MKTPQKVVDISYLSLDRVLLSLRICQSPPFIRLLRRIAELNQIYLPPSANIHDVLFCGYTAEQKLLACKGFRSPRFVGHGKELADVSLLSFESC